MTLAVPQMPESILEGPHETRQKKVADAASRRLSLPRQKIDVSVRAPAVGRITELFANEEQCPSGCDLCAPGVMCTVLVENETAARIYRSRARAIVGILYADA